MLLTEVFFAFGLLWGWLSDESLTQWAYEPEPRIERPVETGKCPKGMYCIYEGG